MDFARILELTRRFLKRTATAMGSASPALAVAGALTLLVLFGLVFRLHRNIVRPLRSMEGTMAAIADSLDFTKLVDSHLPDADDEDE